MPLEQLGLHLMPEDLVTVASLGFGDVHRDVGSTEKLVGVERVGLVVGASDRRRYEGLAIVDREWLTQRVEYPLRGFFAVVPGRVFADDRELVASEPRDGVTVPNIGAQPI